MKKYVRNIDIDIVRNIDIDIGYGLLWTTFGHWSSGTPKVLSNLNP